MGSKNLIYFPHEYGTSFVPRVLQMEAQKREMTSPKLSSLSPRTGPLCSV